MPTVRRARPQDAETLTALAIRSEAHWGCSADHLAAFRREYRITETYIARNLVFLVEEEEAVVGFYAFSGNELEYLYLEPSHLGRGLGRTLWNHLAEQGRRLGFQEIHLICGPEPKAFYLRMGAVETSERASRLEPGRRVSVLSFRLGPDPVPGQSALAGCP